MAHSVKRTAEILAQIIQEKNLPVTIQAVNYRKDYQDYEIVLADYFVCYLREKLIDLYDQDKRGDLKKEIIFRLEHPKKVDEDDLPPPPKPSVDDSLI